MKAVLLRTGSTPVQASLLAGSPKVSYSGEDPVAGILFSGDNKNNPASLRSSPLLQLEIIKEKKDDPWTCIRRAMSEAGMMRFFNKGGSRLSWLTGAGSWFDPAGIPEEKEIWEGEEDGGGWWILKQDTNYAGASLEELDFSGGGAGKGKKVGGGKGGCGSGGGDGRGGSSTEGSSDQSNICAHYQEMLKADPGNPLLLRNYGQFLHEVEKDVVRAEEYYGRAILASPGDGEVLSLYGKLIWETQRDQGRADAYFHQAVQASPDDCFVLGSYAQFLWDAQEAEEETERVKMSTSLAEAL